MNPHRPMLRGELGALMQLARGPCQPLVSPESSHASACPIRPGSGPFPVHTPSEEGKKASSLIPCRTSGLSGGFPRFQQESYLPWGSGKNGTWEHQENVHQSIRVTGQKGKRRSVCGALEDPRQQEGASPANTPAGFLRGRRSQVTVCSAVKDTFMRFLRAYCVSRFFVN